MYADTVTLFNRYRAADGDYWYPTVLHNTDLNVDKGLLVKRYGEETTDNAVLHIRYRTENGEKMIEGKRYLPPKEWERQVNDDFAESITFTAGNDFDFFYLGEWPDSAVIDDAVYIAGGQSGFYEHMRKRYDMVFAVSKVAMFSVIPHFEITAR